MLIKCGLCFWPIAFCLIIKFNWFNLHLSAKHVYNTFEVVFPLTFYFLFNMIIQRLNTITNFVGDTVFAATVTPHMIFQTMVIYECAEGIFY